MQLWKRRQKEINRKQGPLRNFRGGTKIPPFFLFLLNIIKDFTAGGYNLRYPKACVE